MFVVNSIQHIKAITISNKIFTIIILAFLLIIASYNGYGQCSVGSSNGWVANFDITTTGVTPSTTNCPWSYHYEINYDYKVTFTGSSSSRSISGNLYFTCSGGTGGNPYRSLGTFTSNSSGSSVTYNNTRQYTSISNNNYGANPHCTGITIDDVNCTSARIDYWGNGVSNGSCTTTALPIVLLSFSADLNDDGHVQLRWTTAQEINNDYFTIEHSTDGTDWDELYTVKGAGNSEYYLTYDTTDISPSQGTNLYRVRQTDFDGTSSVSPVKEVSFQNMTLEVFPNPARDIVNIVTNQESTLQYYLIDAIGHRTPLYGDLESGYDISQFKPGVYIIESSNSTQVLRKKFVIDR